MKYYVIEMQTGESGTASVQIFEDRNLAEARYHEILMYASQSKVHKHGAMIMTEDMFVVKSEVYVHQDEYDDLDVI